MDSSILLVDHDLGFLFWLGRVLDQAGYDAFPAKSVPDALALLVELHLSVGVLILNCSLPGAEGFIAAMRRSQKHLKAISLVEPGEDAAVTAGVSAVSCKSIEINEQAKAKWLQTVRTVCNGAVAL